MTVWELARSIFGHLVRGRGGWRVLVHHRAVAGVDQPCSDLEWRLVDVNWTGGGDRFIVLNGYPPEEPP